LEEEEVELHIRKTAGREGEGLFYILVQGQQVLGDEREGIKRDLWREREMRS